ncbi:MAG: GatB/YqeY domain-containing protein [Cyclobacteriaceae bacterium]|nr:GatB/YqeY domain-containing protein [Cyclobacteriaceae bacterium]
MSLKETINEDIKQAMLAKRKEELTALRSIKSAILLAETEKGAKEEISEDTEMKLLMKAAKQRKESGELFKKEGRADLADKEFFEFEVISKYLPTQMEEAEVRKALASIIAKVGASSPADMGKVMGAATKELAGKAEGRMISTLVKELLAQ